MTDAQARRILTVNAGSSSLKFAVHERVGEPGGRAPVTLLRGEVRDIGRQPSFHYRINAPVSGAGDDPAAETIDRQRLASHEQALRAVLDWLDGLGLPLGSLAGAGHRVVHGGSRFTAPQPITEEVIAALRACEPLAPHHMPHNIGAILALQAHAPDLPQVACFDTAFHATQPAVETHLPLPGTWFARGIRRYGFHGLNYEHVVHALPRLSGAGLPERLVVLHLGNGASACAIRAGRSIATSMGFSTIDGLLMGTRSGAIDPGVLLHLLKAEGLDVDALEDLLYNRAGLLGVSGISSDMRTLLADGSPEARLAVEMFCHRAARHVGAFLPALGGLDALVFTGGIGENAPEVRARILDALACFGIAWDADANAAGRADIARPGSAVRVWIVPANEELTIARQTFALLDGQALRSQVR